MKRILSVLLILSLCCCMAFPVSATTVDHYRFNVLDLCTLNDEGNQTYLNSGDNSVTFNYGFRSIVSGVDILCKFYVAPSAVYFVDFAGNRHPLEVVSLGNDLYRVYGSFNISDNTNITLVISTTQSNSVDFYSFYVSSVASTYFDSECYCNIGTVDYDSTIHFVPTDEINYRTFRGTDDFLLANYSLYLYNLDWRKYDYVDFLVLCNVDSVSSVTCTIGSLNVPFEVSFIDNDSMTAHDFLFSVRVDCRGLDRSSSDYPTVYVEGNVITGELNMISVMACSGVLDTTLNTEFTLLQRIKNAITSGFGDLENTLYTYFSYINSWMNDQTSAIVSALRGDTAPGDSFQSDVAEKDSELKDMAAIMDSVDKPDVNGIDVNVNDYVDSNILAGSMYGISYVASSPLFSDVLLMAVLLATAGFVLYGKR